MITHFQYVPVLKWRQGEYQALLRLASPHKDSVIPLLEICPPEFDFETQRPAKSLDDHLRKFGARLQLKWGSRLAFIDASLLAENARMADGMHPLTSVLADARARGARLVPVTSLARGDDYQAAVRDSQTADALGVCIRCSLDDTLDENFSDDVTALLRLLGTMPGSTDFVLDLKAANFDPLDGLVEVVIDSLRATSAFRSARSIVLVSSAFPTSMSEVEGPLHLVSRDEWRLYKLLVDNLEAGDRLPTFGDYAIAAPKLPELDMRLLKPAATIRYTIDDAWLIAKGLNVRDNGFAQYRGLCRSIVNARQYLGNRFSEGSAYIDGCGRGLVSTGNLTTWRWVGTNHHLTKVVDDLASFYGS
jgi:hypothetical protein